MNTTIFFQSEAKTTSAFKFLRSGTAPFGLAAVLLGTLLNALSLALAQQVPIPPPPGMVAWWAGDGDARDLAGTNNGILYGGVEFTAGMVGQAFAFHSTGAQVLATAVGLPTGSADRSIECWVRIDQFEADFPYDSVFCGYGPPGIDGASYAVGAESGQLFWSQWGLAIWGQTVATGVWYHVAATSSRGLTTLYLNGTEVANGSLPFNTPDGRPFFMGYVGPGRALEGALDEVSVYDRALPADEIGGIYQAGSTGKIKPSPQLHIGSSGHLVLVWWPTNASGFLLESSTRLGAAQSWSAVPGPIFVFGDQNVVVAEASSGSKYFRLRNQRRAIRGNVRKTQISEIPNPISGKWCDPKQSLN